MNFLSQDTPTGKRVLVRIDYNVPIESGTVKDDTRIKESLPTIRLLLEKRNRIILISYLGRPEGKEPKLTLEPARKRLEELLGKKVILVNDFTKDTSILERQNSDDIILLENIRFYPEEKISDPEFAKKLASLGDLYVNDGFSISHRKSASTTVLPTLLPSFAGLALEKEIKHLEKFIKNPGHPFIAIIGGGKISTKLTLLDTLAKKVDKMLIGGALANNLLKANGTQIGESKHEPDLLEDSKKLLNDYPDKFVLPVDCIVEDAEGKSVEKEISELKPKDQIKDIGGKTIREFSEVIKNAKTILWNGPLGQFEDKRYAEGTHKILIAATDSSATTILGGGDTISAISAYPELAEKISFVSTGGGALLEYLEKGRLPAIDALG